MGRFKIYFVFPEKQFCIRWPNFTFLCVLPIFSHLEELYLGFWQTLKQIYRQLQYWKKSFGKFERQFQFSRKMDLHLLTKFGSNFYQYSNTQNIWLRFFVRLQHKFIANQNIRRNFLKCFKVYLAFPQKWFFTSRQNFASLSFTLIMNGPKVLI